MNRGTRRLLGSMAIAFVSGVVVGGGLMLIARGESGTREPIDPGNLYAEVTARIAQRYGLDGDARSAVRAIVERRLGRVQAIRRTVYPRFVEELDAYEAEIARALPAAHRDDWRASFAEIRRSVYPPPAPAADPAATGNGRLLRALGGRGAAGCTAAQRAEYERTFATLDADGDGRVSRREYVDEGRYGTRAMRQGIFTASDADRDGVLTRKEYVDNRIITDEAKAIFERLDGDRDGRVGRDELAAAGHADAIDVFDGDGDGAASMIEWLRAWGDAARRVAGWTDG